MEKRRFDLDSFYSRVGASAKERSALRQLLVRGLKDYYEALYGYDRYGAETVLLLGGHLSAPRPFGYAVLRILRDRRISLPTKTAVASLALSHVQYGEDEGIPHGLMATLAFLLSENALGVDDLRFGLIVTSGDQPPFGAMERPAVLEFGRGLMAFAGMPAVERAFWMHGLLCRHGDDAGGAALVTVLMSAEDVAEKDRSELAWAWLHARQPQLHVEVPRMEATDRSRFVSGHMPFWIAHSPSWPSRAMVRAAPVWLTRFGADPDALAARFINEGGTFAEQYRAGIADLIAEHHAQMSDASVRRILDLGVQSSGSASARRRFYELGARLYGPDYLHRAASDTAGSVRQWAARQLTAHQ